jgi:hypothetical protein
MAISPTCPICFAIDGVCENHPKHAWSEELGCQCGAGMLCECNRTDGLDEPGRKQSLCCTRPVEPFEAKPMTGKNSAEVPHMRQRTILQHLSLVDWKLVNRLPVSAGEMTLSRLLHHGWIECRGEKQHTAVKLTPAGLKAMRSLV